MTTFQDVFKRISGGRVLDVATGSGGFVHVLSECLKDYKEIVGIDTNERYAKFFEEAFKDTSNIQFNEMNASELAFTDSSFDTVCIANSLHHVDPVPVLQEMKRVLRPEGVFIIAEMFRDNQTETQMTHVQLHHWWAAIDRVNGIFHNETYQRAEIKEMISRLNFSSVDWHEIMNIDDDPKNPEILQELDPVFDRYIQRASGNLELIARGEVLRQRVKEIGFHSATTLVAVGKK
jgi:ubiquinone/menaquinone biosynthesis C-methylase UbiE